MQQFLAKKKPQQMKTLCSLSIEVLVVSGSSVCPRDYYVLESL